MEHIGRGSGNQGQPGLHNKFKNSLDYMRPCLKTNKNVSLKKQTNKNGPCGDSGKFYPLEMLLGILLAFSCGAGD